ncbi:hypothetical protein SAMN05216371_0194 [Streptomyces sp. TLI_053]|nr:hypothetical protein SAMN05216371_0194 [Streptomyces sp. TLI_053]
MRLKPIFGRPAAVVITTALAASLIQGVAARADTPVPADPPSQQTVEHPSEIDPAKRTEILGKGWEHSADKAWTTSGDGDGFHILAANAKDGYNWRTVTTLRENGFDADQWIGNACLTGSGKHVVAVYAPRTFTNKPELFERGGFSAVVDLESGNVAKLPVHASLAYFSPGCGNGEDAVLTQGGEDKGGTRLIRVDAAAAKSSAPVTVDGQVTSAVPVKEGAIVAADTNRLITISDKGERRQLAVTDGTPFHVKADQDGGVVFMDAAGNNAQVKRVQTDTPVPDPKTRTLATGELPELGLTSAAQGKVYITGSPKKVETLPEGVRTVQAPADATVSTEGLAAVARPSPTVPGNPVPSSDTAAGPRPVAITVSVPSTGKSAEFTVTPSPAAEGAVAVPSPALPGSTPAPSVPAGLKGRSAPAQIFPAAAATPVREGSPSDPVETERTCAVPRNDPRNQAMQPKPRQVEWAVDQAVVGNLNIQRPANWKNLAMPAYTPQGLFPSIPLEGGGRVPAQIMLGIIAQESNMWQASRVAVPGVTGNTLIGNFYGRELYNASTGDDWDIHWDKADCGYGLTQQTDGMRLPQDSPDGKALPHQTQRAVALDYATNVAAGLRTLQEKWNQTRSAGMVLNNGDSAKVENWFYAAWAYNSGFYAKTADGSPWGLGWSNNPANPNYPANRKPFLHHNSYADAAHPQNWPYPEKVMGWAAYPIEALESPGKTVSGYRQAWWNGDANRTASTPPRDLFCNDSNSCRPGQSFTPNAPEVAGAKAGPCARQNAAGQYDLKCWFNQSATWKKDCSYSCGNDLVRFNTTYPEEADGTAYPPKCAVGASLPAGALIIDDIADNIASVRPNCQRTPNAGTFTFDFPKDSTGHYPSKVDLHQLGAGFGGHFYFSHTRKDDEKGRRLKITGTWTFKDKVAGPATVYIHIPDHGAQTADARYQVETADGIRTFPIHQKANANRWLAIGDFWFRDPPKISLSTIALDGTGDADIAWDAVAVAPLEPSAAVLPDVILPPENPDAPESDYEESGKPLLLDNTVTPSAKTPSLFRSPKAAAEARTAVRSAAAGAGIPPSLVDWCNNGPGQKQITRFETCFAKPVDVIAYQDKVPVGHARFLMQDETKAVKNNTKIQHRVILVPVDNNIPELTLTFKPQCLPAAECTMSSATWTGSPTWVPGDAHAVSIDYTTTWYQGAKSLSTLQFLSTLTGSVPGSTTVSDATWGDNRFSFRCDERPHGTGFNRGCVVPAYTPTYTVNTARFPTASAMYWILQKRLRTTPGSKANKTPLHREADQDVRDRNRAKICPDNYPRYDQVPKPTCDEYPFAATKESGGQNGATGNDCVQLVGLQLPNGGWELRTDPRPQFSGPPTWSEVCGRATITDPHNNGAGRHLGIFYNAQRVIDNDPFYVDTPGFENCTNTVCRIDPAIKP